MIYSPEKLKSAREAAHQSQIEAAKKFGKSIGTYFAWEHGTSVPRKDALIAVEKFISKYSPPAKKEAPAAKQETPAAIKQVAAEAKANTVVATTRHEEWSAVVKDSYDSELASALGYFAARIKDAVVVNAIKSSPELVKTVKTIYYKARLEALTK